MQLLKIEKRKGISPLIATLLLIAIAVAASVLTYSWVMSMIGSQSAQAQTQVRIDSVTWTDLATYSLNVRNTGSVDAVIESVSIRENKAGSTTELEAELNIPVDTGSHETTGDLTIDELTALSGRTLPMSVVIRVTCTTGFYYEAVFTAPIDFS